MKKISRPGVRNGRMKESKDSSKIIAKKEKQNIYIE